MGAGPAPPAPPPPAPPAVGVPSRKGHDYVAVLLAVGLSTAVNVLTTAALWDAIVNHSGLSENATQVLTSAFGGMVGVLGAYLGYKAGERASSSGADGDG